MGRRRIGDLTLAEVEVLAREPVRARAFVEVMRFPHGLVCPCCGAREEAGHPFVRHRSRPGLFTCGRCRHQFSLTSGTAMHRTRLPLGHWIRAIWLIVASSKGVSARKLSEMLGTTYKVAWHLGHRIRSMMDDGALILSGVVELDEVYAGAPPRKPSQPAGAPKPECTGPTGRGTDRPLVLTMVERGGMAMMRRIGSHSTAEITSSARDPSRHA